MEQYQSNSIELKKVEVNENGNDVVFTIHGIDEGEASLQCEVDRNNKLFTARIIAINELYQNKGLGSLLFITAINYSKQNNLHFVTDYGISELAEQLIKSLISKGYVFIKNPNAVVKQLGAGKRILTLDGSPVYSLSQ